MAQQNSNANSNPTFIGRKGDTGSYDASNNRDLYLKIFSGEMFKGFQHNTIARDLVMKRTLQNARSAQFIYTGRTKAEYHTPGQSILGNDENAPPVAEKTITVDDLLISSAFVYELDEVLAHYDLRSEISRKIGYALAETYDRKIFRAITKGARAAHPISKTGYVEPGGTQIRVGTTDSGSNAYDADKLITAFYDAAAALDEKGVSMDGRVAVLNPRQYYALIQKVGDGGLVNRDVQGSALQSGQGIVEIAGIQIFKSMNIPFMGKFGTKFGADAADNTGVTSPTNMSDLINPDIADDEEVTTTSYGSRNNYGAANKFGHSCGLIFQREAAACVEAMAPQVQVTSGDVSVVYQGDVILGRMALGADYLNPAACVELIAGAEVNNSTENTDAF